MRKVLFAFGIILMVILLASTPASAAKPGPAITITLQNPPADGLLVLGVGETHTFDILIESDEPFVSAAAKVDMFYPGKGVFWHPGSDSSSQATSAELHLTVIGKKSTAGLPEVCDWPTAGTCWPAGTAPQQILAGARFKGGQVSASAFPFTIQVP